MKENKKFNIVKPHFRKNYSNNRTSTGIKNHIALIVGENEKEYAYNSLTHSDKSGHKKNMQLKKNPNLNDKRKAYIRKELNEDKKKNFSKKLKNYKLDSIDENEILNIIRKNKHFN